MYVVKDVMSFGTWAKSLISTVLSILYNVACIAKNFVFTSIYLLAKDLVFTAVVDLPNNVKRLARYARVRRLRHASPQLPRGQRHGQRRRLCASTRAT